MDLATLNFNRDSKFIYLLSTIDNVIEFVNKPIFKPPVKKLHYDKNKQQ